MNPLKANEMPHQEPLVRNKNFLEAATGYDAQTAMDEALRCLHCKHKPCISGCPVQIHIPDFIAKVAEGDFEAAYQIISESSSLPAVCGRASVDWSALWQTGTTATAKYGPPYRNKTGTK